MNSDFEFRRSHEAWRGAFFKNKGKEKCPKCDLYGCICQISLKDWVPISIKIKAPSYAFKVFNCQIKCLNMGKFCLDCFDYNKFEAEVMIK